MQKWDNGFTDRLGAEFQVDLRTVIRASIDQDNESALAFFKSLLIRLGRQYHVARGQAPTPLTDFIDQMGSTTDLEK